MMYMKCGEFTHLSLSTHTHVLRTLWFYFSLYPPFSVSLSPSLPRSLAPSLSSLPGRRPHRPRPSKREAGRRGEGEEREERERVRGQAAGGRGGYLRQSGQGEVREREREEGQVEEQGERRNQSPPPEYDGLRQPPPRGLMLWCGEFIHETRGKKHRKEFVEMMSSVVAVLMLVIMHLYNVRRDVHTPAHPLSSRGLPWQHTTCALRAHLALAPLYEW